MCTHKYLETEYNTQVCTECGLEQSVPLSNKCGGYTLCQPLYVGYSRSSRFRKLLQQLFYPRTHGVISSECLSLLKKEEIKTTQQLLKIIQQLDCGGKNYNNLHMYAVYCVDDYIEPRRVFAKKMNDLLGDFRKVEYILSTHYPNKRFFSYRWILVILLRKHALEEYVQYVKPLVNKRSNKRYDMMYEEVTKILDKPCKAPGALQDFEAQQKRSTGGVFGCRFFRRYVSKCH